MKTLNEARDFVLNNRDEGVHCPACEQFAKIYTRKLNAAMARQLIVVHRNARRTWIHVPDLLNRKGIQTGDFHKLRYWGLLEPKEGFRTDGSKRNGIWRVTREGARFVNGVITLPSHVRIFDGNPLGLTGSSITIQEALGKKFDYAELMRS